MSDKPILLMADDESFMHDFARDALGKEWRVIGCKTVDEVVKLMGRLESRERVSLALLDYTLPRGESELVRNDLIQLLQDQGVKVGIITGWNLAEVRADVGDRFGVPVFDKLEVASQYLDGLQRVVGIVQESGGKRMVEGE